MQTYFGPPPTEQELEQINTLALALAKHLEDFSVTGYFFADGSLATFQGIELLSSAQAEEVSAIHNQSVAFSIASGHVLKAIVCRTTMGGLICYPFKTGIFFAFTDSSDLSIWSKILD